MYRTVELGKSFDLSIPFPHQTTRPPLDDRLKPGTEAVHPIHWVVLMGKKHGKTSSKTSKMWLNGLFLTFCLMGCGLSFWSPKQDQVERATGNYGKICPSFRNAALWIKSVPGWNCHRKFAKPSHHPGILDFKPQQVSNFCHSKHLMQSVKMIPTYPASVQLLGAPFPCVKPPGRIGATVWNHQLPAMISIFSPHLFAAFRWLPSLDCTFAALRALHWTCQAPVRDAGGCPPR